MDILRVHVEFALVLLDLADELLRAFPLKIAPRAREAGGREVVNPVLPEVAELVAVALEDDADLVHARRVII